MKKISKAAKSKTSTLVESITKQLDGSKLPDLKKLEGSEVRLVVKDGKLNWEIPTSIAIHAW